MKQTQRYHVDVPADFAFEWLLHGNFLLSGLDLKSFQYDQIAAGGRFIAYEELNEHSFVPIKGKFHQLVEPSHFQLEVYFPAGEQWIDYRLVGEDRSTTIHVTYTQAYRSLMSGWWRKAFPKKENELFLKTIQREQEKLQVAFHLNRLNTQIPGIKINPGEMAEKWEIHSPSNPYLRWVRPEI